MDLEQIRVTLILKWSNVSNECNIKPSSRFFFLQIDGHHPLPNEIAKYMKLAISREKLNGF